MKYVHQYMSWQHYVHQYKYTVECVECSIMPNMCIYDYAGTVGLR